MNIKCLYSRILYSFFRLQVIIDAIEEPRHKCQKDRPKSLHVQASRILCANYRTIETGSKADLAKCLESFQVKIGLTMLINQ